MNRHIITGPWVAIVVAVIASCQSQQKENHTSSTMSKDTITNQNVKPNESGYADVNGLKMYYEVYGKGKPIVLLHGSFMTIPLNWCTLYPC